MPLSMYRASVPVLLRALDQLSAILDKAEAHAATAKIEPAALVQARLAPDMLTLAGQVQRASDSAKGTAARLSGVAQSLPAVIMNTPKPPHWSWKALSCSATSYGSPTA